MENKFYQLTEEQIRTLNDLSARTEANNQGYRLAAQTFSELQTTVLVDKDAFYKQIALLMDVDYRAVIKAGFAIRIENGVAKIVDLNPKKDEVKNG